MTPAELSSAIRGCVRAAVAAGDLRVAVPDRIQVQRPRRRAHGDWSTGVALQLAGPAGRPAREVAALLAARLGTVAGTASVTVAGPGFLNVVLDASAAGDLARVIVEAGRDYGCGDADAGHPPDEQTHLTFQMHERGAVDSSVRTSGPTGPMDVLVEAVGVDAARFALARSRLDPGLDLDLNLDLLTRRSPDNPVYRVQYAHALLAGVTRNAQAAGVVMRDGFDPTLLGDPTEAALLAALADFPRVAARAARLRAPDRVASYLEELADSVNTWYAACRVTPRGDRPVQDVHRTRLWLAHASRTVLANGLTLLGVSAPERM